MATYQPYCEDAVSSTRCVSTRAAVPATMTTPAPQRYVGPVIGWHDDGVGRRGSSGKACLGPRAALAAWPWPCVRLPRVGRTPCRCQRAQLRGHVGGLVVAGGRGRGGWMGAWMGHGHASPTWF